MATPTDKADFLTTREAAKRIGVALSTVQDWVETGVLKAWKTPGGHRRIPASMVESIRTRQQEVLLTCQPPERFTVLVVEDEAIQRELYGHQFAELNLPIDLHMAENGYQGLVMCGRYKPQLIIADLAMPEMDGFRMIQELTKLGMSEDSIIVITGLSRDEIAARGELPEGVAVLSKPVEFKDLKARLSQRLGNDRRSNHM